MLAPQPYILHRKKLLYKAAKDAEDVRTKADEAARAAKEAEDVRMKDVRAKADEARVVKEAEDARAKAAKDAEDALTKADEVARAAKEAKEVEDARAKAAADTRTKAGEARAKEAQAGKKKKSATAGPLKKRKKETKGGPKATQTLQDIDAEESDDPDSQRKRPKIDIRARIAHLEDLGENLTYRINNETGMTDDDKKKLLAQKRQVDDKLVKAKAEAEDPSYNVGDEEDGSAEDDEDQEDEDGDEGDKKRGKLDMEELWELSFTPKEMIAKNILTKYFNNESPVIWREETEKEAKAHIVKFLQSSKKYVIPADIRRLLRKIPELAPECATSTMKLAYHILTTKGGITQCRFHEEKRGTVLASQVDGPTTGKYMIVGVAHAKEKANKKKEGFFHCGCSEKEALLDFLWFKTWKVKSAHEKITDPESMKSDVFVPRHRAFFAQAYSIRTLLNLDDFYTTEHAFDSPGYDARLRMIQVERMIGVLNALEGDPEEQYVLEKKPYSGDNVNVPTNNSVHTPVDPVRTLSTAKAEGRVFWQQDLPAVDPAGTSCYFSSQVTKKLYNSDPDMFSLPWEKTSIRCWHSHRQRLQKEDPDAIGRKERARESDQKYRAKQAKLIAFKQRLRRQNAYIEKHGEEAYHTRITREQSAHDKKEGAITEALEEAAAMRAKAQHDADLGRAERRRKLCDDVEAWVAAKKGVVG
ncbi:hypothetical protein K438DRAFT_1761947 [Mycena galopus ATCC 62051]|nr:hypothetical protein K438DRAFT_1761947 [Mycena galopus ATCC 62051]